VRPHTSSAHLARFPTIVLHFTLRNREEETVINAQNN
jgi:hypothetical protein